MLWSRFSGEVDVGTWSVLLFSLLLLTIASIYLNLLTRVRSREAIAECSRSLTYGIAMLQSFRCKCSNCSLEFVVKPDECRCCFELDRCTQKIEEIDMEGACITTHSGYDTVCYCRLQEWDLKQDGTSLIQPR